MIVSHAHRFILMSPWKTASSTCHASLEQHNDSRYTRFFHFNPLLNRVVHQHLTLAELVALPEGKLDYEICAFVRNPYDRAYSGFLQIQRDFADQPKRDFDPPWVGDLVRSQISENMTRIIAAQFEFDNWIASLPAFEVFEVGRNTNMVLHPAHYWTHIDGQRRASFVGKVENFASDFPNFCAFVGIETPSIISTNVSDEATEQARAGHSKYAARMSRRSIDRINDLFSTDFDEFEYQRL